MWEVSNKMPDSIAVTARYFFLLKLQYSFRYKENKNSSITTTTKDKVFLICYLLFFFVYFLCLGAIPSCPV